MGTDALLEVRGVFAGYSGVAVINEVDLAAKEGEVVAILGANGAGKTTLLHTIAGALPQLQGEIWFSGGLLTGSVHRRARQGIALVTEERAIIRSLTVKENLKLGTRNVKAALELFPNLEPFMKKKAGLLSGGEQQMLVLARVLANGAQLILVDELSFGLAPLIVKQLLASLREAADRGTAVVVVEQHPVQALEVADRGYVLNRGRVELSGSSEELFGRLSEIEETYLSVVADSGNDGQG
jgi:branched-chain amino acid transport system ATP-binding protein